MNEDAFNKIIAQLEARIADLEKTVLQLSKENTDLRARLRAYENAHTPPSLSKKKREPKETSGKLGAKKGHSKWEREQPEPTKTVEHKIDACPHCNHKLKKPFKIERRVIEEIPKPRPIQVTEHLISHYKCPHCHKKIKAKTGLPKGMFGVNAETLTVLLRFEDRLPLRKTVAALQRQGLNMTNVCVHNISKRTAHALSPEYQKQILLLRTSKVVNGDETELKINGKTSWLWTFVGEQQTIYVIRKSRNDSVPKEILGNDFTGIIISDGHTAYRKIGSAQQRCWAHIIRESKELNDNYPLYKCHHNNLKKIFAIVKETRKHPPPLQKRLQVKQELEKRTTELADTIDSHNEYKTFATKLRNAIPSLFTCIIHLFVEPTNNTAERALRELIVIRKIIGGLRRETGAKIMETIHTMLATWKQQNKPLYPTLKKTISG